MRISREGYTQTVGAKQHRGVRNRIEIGAGERYLLPLVLYAWPSQTEMEVVPGPSVEAN
jgi:hypothetical protein